MGGSGTVRVRRRHTLGPVAVRVRRTGGPVARAVRGRRREAFRRLHQVLRRHVRSGMMGGRRQILIVLLRLLLRLLLLLLLLARRVGKILKIESHWWHAAVLLMRRLSHSGDVGGRGGQRRPAFGRGRRAHVARLRRQGHVRLHRVWRRLIAIGRRQRVHHSLRLSLVRG